MVDLWRRAWMLVIAIGLAVAGGYLGGARLAKQTYESQTSLVYRLNDEKKGDSDPNKNLLTLKSIVKVRSNLEEVREKLKLGSSLQEIGAAIDVEVEKNTNLMTIVATWSNAETAADLANGVREAFLKNQVSLDQMQAQRENAGQKRRMAQIDAELAKADMELQVFTNKNQVTDFVSMARAYMEGYNSVDLLYQTAVVEQKTNQQQVRNLDRIVAEQKSKVASEKMEAAQTESITDLSTRMERLRSAIHDDQELRARQADLALREIELQRLQDLYQQGAVAKKKVDEAKAAYDKQKALTVDTPQVKAWREELAKLQSTVLPSNAVTPSTQLLQEMLSKDFNLQLESVAIESKVESFKRARDDYERKLAALPDQQRQFVILSRRVDALETEKKSLDEALSRTSRLLEITTPDFITVAPAKVPTSPKTSNRKTMTMALTMILGLFGVMGVIGTIFLDSRLKTEGDIRALSKYPVLAELPAFSRKQTVFPPPPDSEHAVVISALSRAVRRAAPKKGARIAVAAVQPGDGASSVAISLATALTRQRELVLLASLAPGPNAVTSALPEAVPHDWVDAIDQEGAALQTFVVKGSRSTPSILPSLPAQVTGDSVTSIPMRNAFQQVSATYDVVVIELMPATSSLQAELIGTYCDGVVLVTKSGSVRREVAKRMERDLEAAGVHILGWVLNSVPRMYQDLS